MSEVPLYRQFADPCVVAAGMDPDRLVIDEILIGRAGYIKQIEFKGRGRTGLRKKPYCYCAVYVREIQPTDVLPPYTLHHTPYALNPTPLYIHPLALTRLSPWRSPSLLPPAS